MSSLLRRSRRLFLLALLAVPAWPQEQMFSAPETLQPVLGVTLEIAGWQPEPGVESHLSHDLRQLAHEYAVYQQTGSGVFSPSNRLLPASSRSVVIDAAASDEVGALRQELEELGLEGFAVSGRMVSGRLPLASLEALERLSVLKLARPAWVTRHAGAVTTQGDTASGAATARSLYGVDGSGVVVGTLSDSFDCQEGAADDFSSGDLPTATTVLMEEVDCLSGSDEGRAMMQLVHDLAPGSEQLFYTGFGGQASFAAGIDALVAAGADVIVDDVLYFAEPMFQDGIVAQAVDAAAAAGVVYFSSAGNTGRESYEGPFVNTASTVFGYGMAHDFDPGEASDPFLAVSIPVGGFVTATLQWDSPFFSVSGPPGSPNDLHLFLTNEPPTVGLAASLTNNAGGDAVEVLQFQNNGSDTDFNLVIEGVSGPVPGRIKIVLSGNGTFQEHETHSSTVYGHAGALGAEAVGAAAYFETPAFGQEPPLLEPFSSAGPVSILYDTAGSAVSESRQKPEIVCTDGGNTTFFGFDIEPDGFPNFFGTSAAAPHAAGIAALILELAPSTTPAALESALESTAVDIGVADIDDDSGHGLCQAAAALGAVAVNSIALTLTPSSASLPEPGGDVTLTAQVDNTGNTAVEITALSDDLVGDLDGVGSCAVPQTIGASESYECNYDISVSGDADAEETHTVTATGSGPVVAVEDSDSATVTIEDQLPQLEVSATASQVFEPGGDVTLAVRVTNAGEALALTALVDDVVGDLDGLGSCGVPQSIDVGSFYECAFSRVLIGNAGFTENHQLTATVEDNEGHSVEGQGSVMAVVGDLLPSLSVTKTAHPAVLEEPGGEVELTIRIDNTGTVEAATLVSLIDTKQGGLNGEGTCSVPQSLPVGAFYECALVIDVVAEPGEVDTGTVTARIEDDEGNQVTGQAAASVEVVAVIILFTDGFESGDTSAWAPLMP